MKLTTNCCCALLAVFFLAGCAGQRPHAPDAVVRDEPLSKRGNPDSYIQNGRRYFVLPTARGYRERGIASWYGRKFHGRETSSGEVYDMHAMTAAHPTLPLPSYVRVTHLGNGRQVVVKVNDRGPFAKNRLIDLSYAAAKKLDMIGDGTARVEVVTVQPVEKADRAVPSRYPDARDWRDESHLRNRIFIQVGAFSVRRNAEQMLERLTSARFDNVQIVDRQGGERLFHRVRIGPLETIAATDSAAARLEKLGYGEYRVVIE